MWVGFDEDGCGTYLIGADSLEKAKEIAPDAAGWAEIDCDIFDLAVYNRMLKSIRSSLIDSQNEGE